MAERADTNSPAAKKRRRSVSPSPSPSPPQRRPWHGDGAPAVTRDLLSRLDAASAPLGLHPGAPTVQLVARTDLDTHEIRPREDGLLVDLNTGAAARYDITKGIPTNPTTRRDPDGTVLAPHSDLYQAEEDFRQKLLEQSADYQYAVLLAGLTGQEPWELYSEESAALVGRLDGELRAELREQRRRILQDVSDKKKTKDMLFDAYTINLENWNAMDRFQARFGDAVTYWAQALTPTGFVWAPDHDTRAPFPLVLMSEIVAPQYAAIRNGNADAALFDRDTTLWDMGPIGAAFHRQWPTWHVAPGDKLWLFKTYLFLRDCIATRAWPLRPDKRLEGLYRNRAATEGRLSLWDELDSLQYEMARRTNRGWPTTGWAWKSRAPTIVIADALKDLNGVCRFPKGNLDHRLQKDWFEKYNLHYRGPTVAAWNAWHAWLKSNLDARVFKRIVLALVRAQKTQPVQKTQSAWFDTFWASSFVLPKDLSNIQPLSYDAIVAILENADAFIKERAEDDSSSEDTTKNASAKSPAMLLNWLLRIMLAAPRLEQESDDLSNASNDENESHEASSSSSRESSGAVASKEEEAEYLVAICWIIIFNETTADVFWHSLFPVTLANDGEVTTGTASSPWHSVINTDGTNTHPPDYINTHLFDNARFLATYAAMAHDLLWPRLDAPMWQNLLQFRGDDIEEDELKKISPLQFPFFDAFYNQLLNRAQQYAKNLVADLTSLNFVASSVAPSASDFKTLSQWQWGAEPGPPIRPETVAFAEAEATVGAGDAQHRWPLPSEFMRPLEAWSIFLERYMPKQQKRLRTRLVSTQKAFDDIDDELEAMGRSDVSAVHRPVLELLENLYRPERAFQMRALLTGQVRFKSTVMAALAKAHADVQRHLPGWAGVPCDLLTRGTDKSQKHTAPPELAADFAQLHAVYMNKTRLLFPDAYKTQAQYGLALVELSDAIATLRTGYRCRKAADGAYHITAVPRV